MKEFNLGWGNSVAVRDAFLETTTGRPVSFGLKELGGMDYPPHEGDARLIEITRKVIERQVGPTYDYILLANGASGAATIAMRAYKQRGYNTVFTRSPPYFPIYPAMIASAGLRHVSEAENRGPTDNPIALIDSPTNPQGLAIENLSLSMPTIWDAVYHSKVYTYGNFKPLPCDVLVGSYSKLTGLNGLRTGWIATNDQLLYTRMKELVTAEYCGLSSASTHIILELLGQFKDVRYWESFENNARYWLDYNRGEWSKLTKYFGDAPVTPNGMFYYAYMDRQCKRLFNKANITWTTGSSLGADDDFGRFNLGQGCKTVKEAVKQVLACDKVRRKK